MAIREISKGKYQLIVDEMRNGKRFRKTKIVECGKRELNKLYDEFKIEVSKPTQDSCTVEKLIESYIEDCEIRKLSVNTLRGYKTCSKRLIKAFGETLARDLTSYTVNEFIRSQVKLGRSPKTIKNTTSLLTSAYEYAIDMGLLNKTPCKKLRLPKMDGDEKKILDEDEIKTFIECLDGIPQDDKVAFLLALMGGLRKGEIQGLRESDIGFDFNTVSVTRTRYDKVEQIPKTDNSNRVARYPDWVMKEIRILIDQHENHEWLIQYCGEPVKEWYLGDRMRRFANKYGFDITLHGLRHTFASMLIASRLFDVAEISKAMGHASITITLDTYGHLFKKVSVSAKRIADFTEQYDEFLTNQALEAL